MLRVLFMYEDRGSVDGVDEGCDDDDEKRRDFSRGNEGCLYTRPPLARVPGIRCDKAHGCYLRDQHWCLDQEQGSLQLF